MLRILICAFATALALASASEAAPVKSLQFSGKLADGGWVAGVMTLTDDFGWPGLSSYAVHGEIGGDFRPYLDTRHFAFEKTDRAFGFSGRDANPTSGIVTFPMGGIVTGSYNLLVGLKLSFKYLGDAGTLWTGDLSQLGEFTGGEFGLEQNYHDIAFYYDTKVTSASVAPVPVPPALPLLGAAILGLAALGLRRREPASIA